MKVFGGIKAKGALMAKREGLKHKERRKQRKSFDELIRIAAVTMRGDSVTPPVSPLQSSLLLGESMSCCFTGEKRNLIDV